MEKLQIKVQSVQQRIATAAARSSRDAQAIILVAATKTVSPEIVNDAVAAGLTVFGENRIQEAKSKIPHVSGRAHWHFIGHLQSNKARDAVELFEMIQSVDSIRLAEEISKHARQVGKTMPILLEVNVADEKSKFGFEPEGAFTAVPHINSLPNLELHGLMCVPPIVEDLDKARPFFRKLRELKQRIEEQHGIPLQHLSMGMSHDFEVAIEEGATIVRIGTAIFGEREKT